MYTKNKTFSIPNLRTKSISIQVITPSSFRPAHEAREWILTPEQNKPSSTRTMKPRQLRSRTQRSSQLQPHHWKQEKMIPTLVSSRLGCPDPKTQQFWEKTCGVRPLHKNQIRTNIPHWNEVISDNQYNNRIRFIFHGYQLKFDNLHWIQVSLNHRDKMQVSLLTINISYFRPALKK